MALRYDDSTIYIIMVIIIIIIMIIHHYGMSFCNVQQDTLSLITYEC